MKRILGLLLMIAAIVGGLYFGAWICFCKPIADTVVAITTGSISTQSIAWTAFKIFFGTAGVEIIAWIVFTLGLSMLSDF